MDSEIAPYRDSVSTCPTAEPNMQYDNFRNESNGSPTASEASHNVRDDLKRFIYTYETCRALWNPNDKNYLNKKKKIEELDKLLAIYRNIKTNATRDDVKKKINSLRSNYRKELKKIEQSKRSGSRADSIYKPTSSTFSALKFLAKVVKPVSNKKDSSQDESQESLVISSITSGGPSPKIGKKTTRVKGQQFELLDRASTLSSQATAPSRPTVNPLVLVWAEKLTQLTPTQRLYAEKAINDVLFEAQLNNLHRNSVQINSYVTPSSPARSALYPYTPSPINPPSPVNHLSENSNSVFATQSTTAQ